VLLSEVWPLGLREWDNDKDGDAMEQIKSFEELLSADDRWMAFVRVSLKTGKSTPISLADQYKEVASIQLNTDVPEDVSSQFNVARMLRIYAWLYFPFHQVAELKAFSTVEMALRHRFPHVRGMRNLLKQAIERGYISDDGFSHIESAITEDRMRYSRTLPDIVPSLRNSLAHGSTMLHPGSLFTLRNCAEIINQLFPARIPREHDEEN
jgi:hypothetical protein